MNESPTAASVEAASTTSRLPSSDTVPLTVTTLAPLKPSTMVAVAVGASTTLALIVSLPERLSAIVSCGLVETSVPDPASVEREPTDSEARTSVPAAIVVPPV